jgi:hypothetical protein
MVHTLDAGCYAQQLGRQEHATGTAQHAGIAEATTQQQQQQRLDQQLHGVLQQLQHSSSSSTSHHHAAAAGADTLPQRSLLGFTPSHDEQHTKHEASMSAGHVFGVTLLCLLAMAALGFIGYKAMQWYERVKRPGYVELQALDTAFFKPTFTL